MDGTGVWVLIATLAVATVIGLELRRRSGRVRVTSGTPGPGPAGWTLVGSRPEAGERALLLQLSSPVCAPCRQTAAVLGDLAAHDPTLRHVEVDVADRTDLARALGVLRTPTTVVFDRHGAELLRVSGVPRADELSAALGDAPGPDRP